MTNFRVTNYRKQNLDWLWELLVGPTFEKNVIGSFGTKFKVCDHDYSAIKTN